MTRLSKINPSTRISITITYVLAIFLTLPYIREWALLLRSQNLLGTSVNVIYSMAGCTLFYLFFFVFKIRNLVAIITTFLSLAIFAYFLGELELPEERIHFVEYGFLSVLIYYSLSSFPSVKRVSIWTFLIGSTLGIIDEVIQYFLPSRYFDLRDIGFNVCAALLGTLICVFVNFYAPQVSTKQGSLGDNS